MSSTRTVSNFCAEFLAGQYIHTYWGSSTLKICTYYQFHLHITVGTYWGVAYSMQTFKQNLSPTRHGSFLKDLNSNQRYLTSSQTWNFPFSRPIFFIQLLTLFWKIWCISNKRIFKSNKLQKITFWPKRSIFYALLHRMHEKEENLAAKPFFWI